MNWSTHLPRSTSMYDVTGNGPTTMFPTSNGTNVTAPTPEQMIDFFQDEQIAFLVILLLLIIVGNSTVLAAIALSHERRRSRMNFFIMHLALADFLNGPLNVMIDLICKVTIYWYAGNVMCKVIQYIRSVVMFASTYMLVSLSIDRLDAVARPMLFSGSWKRGRLLIGGAWVLSLIFSIPMLVLFHEAHVHGGPQCYITMQHDWHWQLYLTLIAISVFVVPAVIICFCYLVIIFTIWRSSILLKPQDTPEQKRARRKSKDEELLTGSLTTSRSDSCTSSRGIIPQAKVRTIKMTFIIVLVFIVCWSPYFIFNLFHVYGYVPHTPTMGKISTFVQSLAPLNCAANPVIYGIFSTRICKYLRRVYVFRTLSERWCRCCNDDSPRGTSATEYTSMSETDDIRLTADPGTSSRVGRVPYVRQKLSEADREILSLHVTSHNI
ncbi:cardioacceleratory peptide receptor-like [Haliotis asinina]|uniref:cardioacceleratory peptide receptor-like n=1 Tax=Haliotis asinina TaxID=109174 RepID=UPI0035320754